MRKGRSQRLVEGHTGQCIGKWCARGPSRISGVCPSAEFCSPIPNIQKHLIEIKHYDFQESAETPGSGAGSQDEVWAHSKQTINLSSKCLLTRKWLLGELLGLWNYPIYLLYHSLSLSLFFCFSSWPRILVRSLEKKKSSELAASMEVGRLL